MQKNIYPQRIAFIISTFLYFLFVSTTSQAQCDLTVSSNAAAYGCYSTLEDVVWMSTSAVNVTVTGTDLSKSGGGSAWNAGAFSTAPVYNNGYVETVVAETNKYRAIGLSNTNPDAGVSTILYAAYLRSDGTFEVYESGASRGNMGAYNTGDTIRVKAERGQIKYYRNSTVVYISALTPTFPLYVDVSLYNNSSTLQKVVIGNLSNGTFKTTASTLGTGPSYQWKLNGTNVGTNSATYTNTSLASNDVLTCVLTPGSGGCSASPVTSNNLKINFRTVYNYGDFYISATPVSSGCAEAIAQVVWDSSSVNLSVSGNNLNKIQSNGSWNGGAASLNTVSNNGYLQFTATETNKLRAVGLSTTNTNSNYNTIQYAFYLSASGTFNIYESGNNRGSFGTYSSNDVFKISVEAGAVKYYQNGTLVYISNVSPTLPMLVDVSINNTGGTVTNALVSNTSGGTFTATASSAGSSPTYQWKLNGTNVGTNSATYTNVSLSNNDVVTCTLTPNLNGCSSSAYTSNSITYKKAPLTANIEFYIQGTSTTSACFAGEEQVRWKVSDLTNVTASGNNLSKFQSGGNWDGGASSWNTVVNSGYFQFTATETNTTRAAGLSASNANSNYNTIQYAFYLTNTGTVQITESGSNRGTFGSYISGDVFKVAVESNVVKYYQNGNLLYISTIAPSLPLVVDVSINTLAGTISSAVVGNNSSGTYTATALNAGASPTYQWQVNGSNVGTNSATYTNTALAPGDVVSCMLTPNLTGCTSNTVSSNTIINKVITNSSTIEFYIQGLSSGSGCSSPEEQVRWKNTDLNFVVSNGSSLTKLESDGNWDGGAASWNTVYDNGYVQFTATETNKARMLGLSASNTNNSYTTIQYAFYLTSSGSLQIYESGNNRGTYGTYATNDVLKISSDNGVIKYFQNGTLLYISGVSASYPLLVDVSINNAGGTFSNVVVSNMNVGYFKANAINAGASPSYQWKLNGVNVGTNSATYTNTALAVNDVVTCSMTPSLTGCGTAVSYTSNSITQKVLTTSSTIDVFISGQIASAACRSAEEQVKWQSSSFSNVVLTSGSSLYKFRSNNNWDGSASSYNAVDNNGYLQFTATENNTYRAVGLSAVDINNNYNTIQYAFYLTSGGTVQITESGSNRGTFGSYNSGDLFSISVESSVVKYYQNGTLIYISNVAPTLPMQVDISLYSVGATVTNPVVSNYNAGVFTALVTNAGAFPVYQWKLNGVNVGTNSTSYTNTSLAVNDVLTCVVTPNVGGCSSTQYVSNSITNRVSSFLSNVELYIAGTAATSACNTGEEDVRWKLSDLANVTASGNSLNKIQSDGNWDGGAASWNKVSNNGYFQFVASETNTARMIGLSTTNTNSNYTSIQYAFYLLSTGTVQVYESGNNKGTFNTYSSGDVFKIAVENSVIKYYQNGTLLYTSTVPPTLPLLVDVSIKNTSGTIQSAVVSNYNTGSFTATVSNIGSSPSYQWKLNGTNVGTNSISYTNTALANNDILTCVVTSSVAGCSTSPYTSNQIVNKSITAPTTMEFYIQGSVSASACNLAEEQVKWKNNDYSFVTGSGNNLVKVQSDGNWDGGAASWNTVSDNGYFQFVASETNMSRMAGLSATNTDASYTSIQYAIYLLNTGSVRIYESGTDRGAFSTYTSNDVFKISVESGVVKYYQNGTLLYISSIAPSLPMLVDISIKNIGGTITNAVVGNSNTGTFTATAINAGVSPSYQWQVNGVNVGTNSVTYTNASLVANDVVSCILTPSIAGCTAIQYASNSIVNKPTTATSNIEFYVQGTSASSACLFSEEQVRWKVSDLNNVQTAGNNLSKVQSNGNWDGGAASWNLVSNNGYAKFIASETGSRRMLGLSTTNADANYTSIQYAFYLDNSSVLRIYESGNSQGTFGTYISGDTLQISVEANVVKYYQNSNLLYISSTVPVLPLLVDVSINTVGGTLSNVVVGNYNTGSFTAVATNAGTSPSYQWKVNGVNVGTNSTSYTNTTLTVNDVVTCILTPNLSGCGASTYTSNTVTQKRVSYPLSMEFYVAGSSASAACNVAEEQIHWKVSDLNNLQAVGNNLIKIQSNGNWDGGASSSNAVSNNGYFQFTITETNAYRAAGLSSSNIDANYNTIQYAFYMTNAGALYVFESGSNKGSFGTYLANDVLKIAVENNVVKYYQNGSLIYISSQTPSLPLIADVSVNAKGGTVTNGIIGNLSGGSFTAVASNIGTSPVYQWKLNGSNVGTNNIAYSNTALNNNDVVTCVLTPNLGGCSTAAYTSSGVTYKSLPVNSSIDFYIKGTAVSTSCKILSEQVKWKTSDLFNLSATNNNLIKLQSNNSWNGGAASWNTVSNNGYLSFNVGETNTYKAIGLSTSNADATQSTIQYAFYLTNTGSLQIMESGSNLGAFGSYSSSDTLKIAVESNVVKYYQNSSLIYVSSITPTLPLLVDVSLYSIGATVQNTTVNNYNNGTFIAAATNAGTSPSYQWKLNGTNVGTNSNSYTNASLSANDVVTCLLTPNISGCSGTTYTSNTVTNLLAPISSNADVYILATVGSSSCNSIAEESVKWKVSDLSSTVVASTNNLTKVQSGTGWDGGAASWNTVSNNGYLQFSVQETGTARMVGLSNTNADANYNTIQYAFYLTTGGSLQIFESGNGRGSFGTYASGDVLKISVESNIVKYYKNTVLLYVSSVTPTLPMLVDVSINSKSGTVVNAVVGNYTSNTFTAASVNVTSPTYQWKLNGVNVGTNSSTYTNTALASGDAVSCVLTSTTCGTQNYTSNTVVEKLGPVPANLDFYIKGTTVSSSCNLAEEQVKWKTTDVTSNVQATSNYLYKVSSNNAWDGGAASWNTVSNNGYLQFTATESNKTRAIGLSITNTDANYTSIQYAVYLQSNTTFQVMESGVNKGSFGNYASGDVFKVSVESNVVKYYKNGTLFYTSATTPTLPLLVDVSLYHTGATVGNALVANYNAGAFTATAVNAGASPSYQWQLNGNNVGTNSASYTNASLSINDVVTCVLTPNLGGCTLPSVTSNAVTNKSTAAPAAVEFYIASNTSTAACSIGESQVVWKISDLTNIQATGNNLNKISSNGNWDGGAASWNTVKDNGYLQFTATETNKSRMVGLSNTNASAHYNTIQYAFYIVSNSTVRIYESGVDLGSFSTYSANDVFKIAVESSVVKYYQNGSLLYISTVAPTLPLLADVSIRDIGGTVTNALIGNLNTGAFTATAFNAGTNPSYQWKLNGSNVGTNSTSYSNASLVANDVVTCVLTPDLGSCGAATYTSNSITQKATLPPLAGIDFYVQGAVATSACNIAEEQVVWKTSDLNNVQATNNSLLKIQSNGNWDGGAASKNTVNNNGYFLFTATETNKSRMIGLSSSNTNSDYATIQYAIYLLSNSTVQIYESGSNMGTMGSYSSGDVFKVSVESNVVKYYQNGTLLYISNTSPVLPLLVDVSINAKGGTVTNAIVANSNTGTFTAIVTNAGASPTYQWKLNGTNVGTNSSTYANASLNNGDLIVCMLKPALNGCTATSYTSNTVTNKTGLTPAGIDFYITGTVASTACNTTEEEVKWKVSDLTNVQATGNSLLKIQSNSNWDGGAASWNTVSNNGYFQFTATETNKYRAVGLSSVNANSGLNSIQYAFYLVSNGTVQIYESGTYKGAFGAYASNDVFKISVEAGVVKYYKNGTLLYISTVTPTLPLLVDVSIYNTGGTVSNAIVSNYNTGTFTATAVNAGTSPSYQWKVNGTNTGTNSSTYTNTSLNVNDVVTCMLTPNLGGCTSSSYMSNAITNKVVTNLTNIDFYVQGTATTSACNTVDEQVKWKNSDLVNLQATNNNLLKIQSNGNWDGGAASWNTVKNNGYFQFTATETNAARMAGLSSANTGSDYASIQFAIYLTSTSLVQIYEFGTNRGTIGAYVSGDVFKISVEVGIVKYYQNNNLIYISNISPTLPLLADVSINTSGGTISNAIISNYNSGTFTATATNAGASPVYQWKLNGSNVGTNSTTYTNTSLNSGDVVTCVLTPNIAGCNLTTYTSNTLTNTALPTPLNFDFYIQGIATSSGCNTATEEVRWKNSDLTNVVASGNSITKVQSNGNWDGGAASWNTVKDNGYFQFSVTETANEKVVGLSNTNIDNRNTTIQYGLYLKTGGALSVIESSTNRGTFGNYAAGDVFKITVEAGVVKYYKNNTLVYISGVTPTLPLLVDVSLKNTGGYINSAVISNYNQGDFTAVVSNGGASPKYQWKLNGVNVGTNSSTYTNSTLASSDVITCLLTPSLGGCSNSTYVSNSITNSGLGQPSSVDFYLLGTVVASSCSNVDEQVRWKSSDLQNVSSSGNNLTKIQSNNSWNGGAASFNTVSNNGYFQFSATETNTSRMIGLSSSNANSSYTSIQYAFYLTNSGTLSIYESGNNRGTVGGYASGDVFKIAIQSNVVKYYKNNVLLYTSSVNPTLPLLADVSLFTVGATVTNALISNLNAGTFTATATNVGTNPIYQWKLNGANVGSNSTAYTNVSLTNNDVLTCLVTPDLPGCSVTQYVSNTATYRATTITTQPLSQSVCIGGATTLSVTASGNSLNYQWRKNGVNIAGAMSSTYTISPVTAGSTGNYDVIVNTGGCISNAAVITVSTQNQWAGTVSSAWTNSANWTCGIVPTSSTDAIIPSVAPNMPVISSNVSVNGLTINSSGTLTNSAGTVNLYGNIVNSGTYIDNGTTVFTGSSAQSITGPTNFNNVTLSNSSGLTLNSISTISGILTLSTGTFTTNGNLSIDLYWGSVSGTGSGSTTGNIRFFKTIYGNKYHYISSPIPGRTAADWNDNIAIKFGASANLYYYDETIPDTTVKVGWTAFSSLSQPLQTMTGYALYFKNYNTVIDVTGPYTHASGTYTSPTLTNTKSTIPTFKPASDGWNHLGNPYPTTIDWNAPSGWTKTGIDNAVYYWDPANNRFAAYVSGTGINGGSQYIPSMQGFFVKVTTSGGTGSVSMNNNVRTTSTNRDVWRTASDEVEDVLRLSVSTSGAAVDETVVRLSDSASTAFDSNYDAYKMMNEGQTPSFFSTYNGDNYAINSLPADEMTQIIPLTLNAKTAGIYTFNADITGFEKVDSLVLVDQETGIRQDLRTNPTYSCDLPQGVISSRFYINYKKESVVTGNPSNLSVNQLIKIYSYEQRVTVDFSASSVTAANIMVYDLKGHVVYKVKNQPVSGKMDIDLPFVSAGIYVVKVESDQTTASQGVYLAK